jgi:4-diphosphocytidyl-2-C-methyl-D-erythritol kinase
MALEPPHQREGVLAAVQVERKNQFVGHRRCPLMRRVKQFAPAKINLYLHILGKRDDGYHDLDTLMAPITLGDTLDIELIPGGGIEFTCSDPALANVEDNLATRAAKLFLHTFELETGVRIHLEKSVPVGAGLGGGSSDGAAVLLALRELTGVKSMDLELGWIAAQIGSDMAFFVYRTAAVCTGRGEIVRPIKLQERYAGLLVHPGFGVSTPWAYQAYARNPHPGEVGRTFPDMTLRNDLEPPAFGKYPWLPTVKKWFRAQEGVRDALMSGSGSSVFALTSSKDAAEELRGRFLTEFGANLFARTFEVQG